MNLSQFKPFTLYSFYDDYYKTWSL